MIEPNTTGMKWFLKIFYCWCLAPTIIKEALHITDGNRFRDPKLNIRQSSGIVKKRGRNDCRSHGINGTARKATESTNLSSYGLPETELTARETKWDRHRPSTYIYYSCITWFSCKTLNSERSCCIWLWCQSDCIIQY